MYRNIKNDDPDVYNVIKKELSPVEVVKDYFRKIEKEEKEIRAFLTLTKEKALLEAKKAEEVFFKTKTKDDFKKIPLLFFFYK